MSAEFSGAKSELFPDGRLTRDEAIEACLRPDPGVKKIGRAVTEKVFPLTSTETLAVIRPSSALILPQIRGTYSPKHFQSIGDNIDKSRHGQLQNCCVAVFSSDESLQQYLEDASDHHGLNLTQEVAPIVSKLGGRVVTICGHNRQLGIGYINKVNNGHPDHGRGVNVRPVLDPFYEEALAMQAAENTGITPDIWQRAASIKRYAELMNHRGTPATLAQIGKVYSITEDNVWRAFKFMDLPDQIRELVQDGKLPYTGAIEIDRLKNAFSEEEAILLAKKFAESKLSSAKIIDEIQKLTLVIDLPPAIYGLNMQEALSVRQIEVLHNMLQAGCSEDDINYVGVWAATNKPDLATLRQEASRYVIRTKSGIRSLFDDDSGSAPEEAQALRTNSTSQLVKDAVYDVGIKLKSIKGLLAAGAVGKACELKPAQNSLLSALGTELEDLPMKLLELLADEAASSAEDQASIIEYYRDEIDRITRLSAKQPALF